MILFALVLLCAWGLIRWPICAELTRLDLEEDAETRMSDDAANQLVVVAGLSSLVLITAIPLAIIGAGAAAVAVDLRYASLIVLAIMPLTFVELWRRPDPFPVQNRNQLASRLTSAGLHCLNPQTLSVGTSP